MKPKEITVVFYSRKYPAGARKYEIDETCLPAYFSELEGEFAPFGVMVAYRHEKDTVIDVKGYGDLLNAIRIRSPRCGIGNPCLGHVIGASQHLDIFEDIRRGINRVAFAPETIEPEGSAKIVCHNCGCGC